MNEDELLAKLPKPSPTVAAASAIGIKVPSKEDGPVDPNTGLEKKKTGPKTLTGNTSPLGKDVKTDSEGNIVTDPEPTKEDLLEEKIKQTLKYRKAESQAAAHNAMIDAKIEKIQAANFQKSQIETYLQEVKTDNKVREMEQIKTMANREKNKKPHLDGDDWTANMPEHLQKEGDDAVKGKAPTASSLIINATSAASVMSTGSPT